MHSPAALLPLLLAALSSSVNAAAIAPRQTDQVPDPKRADFRTFGGDDCFTQNQGIYTLTQSDAGECRTFVDAIGSLRREDWEDDTCVVTIYTDANCSEAGEVLPHRGVCAKGTWLSYQLVCQGS